MTKTAQKKLKQQQARQKAIQEAMKTLLERDPKFKDLDAEAQMKQASDFIDAQKEEAAAVGGAAAAASKADGGGGGAAAPEVLKEYSMKLHPTNVAGTYADIEDRAKLPFPRPGKGKMAQTWPEPTVPVSKQFLPQKYPEGLVCLHGNQPSNAFRVTSEEKRALERLPLSQARLYDLRHAAEVHRQVRTYVQSWIAPGMPLMTIVERLEKKLAELIGSDGLKRGQAFPTGMSINDIAAHDSVNTGDKRVLQQGDVLKIDFGTHVNGNIIDCAWSVHFDPRWDALVEATKAATAEGIRQAGVDARLSEIGGCIQEVMESFEVEINGKTYGVKPLANLSGHGINPYVIHSGKSVHIVRTPEDSSKMEEGEQYAIETFGSVKGKGVVFEDPGPVGCSHYMMKEASEMPGSAPRSDMARKVLQWIQANRSTLAFSKLWLDRAPGMDKNALALKQLCDGGYVRAYPPLCDIKGSMTSQEEHTLLLRPTCKEVLSKGMDF